MPETTSWRADGDVDESDATSANASSTGKAVTTGSPFGPAREPSATRQRMLDVARELFCARGYERTPLRTIADALGVTKAAVYHHFKAKDDLLVAIVAPMLDRLDSVAEDAGPNPLLAGDRRAFLARYVEELCGGPDVAALLLRDPAVAEHALGRRFAGQRARMRVLLGEVDDPASRIRTTTALRALELAVVDFASDYPSHVRETAVNVAVAVLDSGAAIDRPD